MKYYSGIDDETQKKLDAYDLPNATIEDIDDTKRDNEFGESVFPQKPTKEVVDPFKKNHLR